MEIDHWYLGVRTHEILSNIEKAIVQINTILDKVSELVDKFITNEPRQTPCAFCRSIEIACDADTQLKSLVSDVASIKRSIQELESYGQVNEWNAAYYLRHVQGYESRSVKIKENATKALDLIESVFKYYRGDRMNGPKFTSDEIRYVHNYIMTY